MASTESSARPKRWRRFGFRPGLVSFALFAVVAGALFGAILILFSTIEAERVQRAHVVRTNEILLAMEAVDSAALHGETGQRGYFITSDRRYLEPYLRGLREAPLAMARLWRAVGEDAPAAQLDLVDEIGRLSDAKWAEMADTVALVDQGRVVEAHTRILSDEGQIAMIRLRAAIRKLEGMERETLAQAARRTASAEARIVPSLVGLTLLLLVSLTLGLWQVVRAARMEEAAANADAIAQARDRADLVARELNHRAKNLFSVILAIVKMSGKGVPEAQPVVERIAGRIHALARAHDVTQGRSPGQGIALRGLVATAVEPYLSDAARCDMAGPDVALNEQNTVPLGLVLHELVTNAVKYGAWSEPGGVVQVRWGQREGRITLEWLEEGPCEVEHRPAARSGFGTLLIDSAARQMGGRIERSYHPRGIAVRLDFPAER